MKSSPGEGFTHSLNDASSTVFVYRYLGSWQLQHSFTFSTRDCIYTMTISQDKLHICPNNSHRIDIYSLDGKQQLSFGKFGSGSREVCLPYLCRGNSHGFVLVADSNNDRLTVMGTWMRWGVFRLQPVVTKPRSAVLHNDKLFVVSKNSPYTLYAYTRNVSSTCTIS